MPRKDEPDSPSTGKQSPEAAKENSPSPDLNVGERDSSVNIGASVDPTVQEVGEASGDYLEEPSSADAVSEESLCSRCGRSKSGRDKDGKALTPTQPTCTCVPELHELQQERENLDAGDVSVASDALSDDSVCPRCGGTRHSKSTGLKTTQFLCKCLSRRDEQQDVENVPLQEIPRVAVAIEETSQIETFGDQNPDLGGEESPPEGEPLGTDPNRQQRRDNNGRDREALQDPDFGCGNFRWDITCVIFSVVSVITGLFVFFLILQALEKRESRGKGSQ